MSRVVLVTGCTTGGIGYALAEEFGKQGCTVYATSRRVETIASFSNPKIHKLALDVTSDEDVQSAIQSIITQEGKIDVVVNNAGTICPGALIDNSLDDVKKNFDTNTFAILRISKAVIPEMAKRKEGIIVNIGSLVGEIATPWNGVYCATKAAVNSISQVLAVECKPLNIKVLHVAPGAVKSNIADSGARTFSLPADSLYKAYLANIMDRIYSSQDSSSMPAEVFAKRVVAKTLQKNPPQYMSLGGHSLVLTILKWLPRAVVLGFMCRKYLALKKP
ncbi:oxidoreductase [Macrolepiota fuliginosa MF-IS2]|uniref:Oxidoreductase n=1 Tax=Macrolepiota fuliginosa MF-IS2 TaxID=1400762 RepID=A0A9P5XNI9_9AGAR|nr:oxidoreductase [Macrolepiota fuliginosa MF-IS2]